MEQNHQWNSQVKDMENKLDEQAFVISQLTQELNDQKSTSAQLRYLSEEAEHLVQENQRQLNVKKEELRAHEEKSLRLEKKLCRSPRDSEEERSESLLSLDEMQEANKGIKDDFHVVRNTVQTLDKEKDRLCSELDRKAEENLHLIQEMNSKVRRIEELNIMVTELEAALE